MSSIESTTGKIQDLVTGDAAGHDFQHTRQVYRNACRISETEDGTRDIMVLASLLHNPDDENCFIP